MYCPKCTGTMEACNWGSITCSTGTSIVGNTGMIITTNPPSFVSVSQTFNHKCNKCGHGDNYDKNYPYIDYIEDGDLG